MKGYLPLLIVCTLILGARSYSPYKEFDPYPFTSPNTCASSSSSWVNNVRNALAPFQLSNRLVTNSTELLQYAEDYGHIYHRAPQAAFVANTAQDVAALVSLAKSFRNSANRFQIVVRGGSGNVQGATQVGCDSTNSHQILLDMSLLSSVKISNSFAWVGAGSSWLNFVQQAAAQNLRPTVIPDYLGITVGGYLGIGGFGPDSAAVGPAIDQVLELEVVTPTGTLKKVSPQNEYFQAVRGGMGSFGIVTSIKYRLEKNAATTRVYHILTSNYNAFFNSMNRFVDDYIPKKVHTLQSFAISNTELNLIIFVAPKEQLDQVRPAVDQILAQNQPYVYYLELTIRGSNNFLTKKQIAALLPSGMNEDLIFIQDQPTMDFDNRLKLFTVPALVADGSWYKRHPWGLFMFPDSKISTFKNILDNYDNQTDSGYGLIAIYPYRTRSVARNSFLSVPRSDDHFYLISLGRNELTNTEAGLAHMGQDNRNIWNTLAANSDSTVYPSLYIPDFGPSDWAKHYGSQRWQSIRRTKKDLDPYFLLADQRNFGFASVY